MEYLQTISIAFYGIIAVLIPALVILTITYAIFATVREFKK